MNYIEQGSFVILTNQFHPKVKHKMAGEVVEMDGMNARVRFPKGSRNDGDITTTVPAWDIEPLPDNFLEITKIKAE